MKLYVSVYFVVLSLIFPWKENSDERLIGRWKLISYDAIDVIRLSDGYQLADEYSRNMLEDSFEMTFDSTYYEFGADTLKYSSVESDNVVHRRAIWKLIDDTLMIKEIDRIYFRKALLRRVSDEELVISPIINDVAGENEMIFKKIQDSDF
ncbi:hypothetical protein [Algoriphagus terrigena]|uniref:hypothetical protein n=1 Tax=Algoriphagus terrigena TaxID=344884 RepID=UPI00047C3954|nr:hypothetical protein [Algoriphagus terrigena]